MEWTREKTLMLINEYRQRRGLWDMTSDEYRKKETKTKLLKEVSAKLGGDIPIIEIEKKFHTLRTQYHREINRMNRKQHTGSKWFGFHNLKFLSSPKACRSGKGRIKTEVADDGMVTAEYIIREGTGEDEMEAREFIAIPMNPKATISYEEVPNNTSQVVASASRSRELEKLIEETTKDVDETDELKPKLTIKQIPVPLEHQTAYNTIHANNTMEVTTSDQGQQQNDQHGEQEIETINLHQNDEEIVYHSANNSSGINSSHNDSTQITHHNLPTRIIKIQRSNTCQEDDYYEEEQQQHTQHQMHAIPSKRIYFEDNGQHHTTILTGPTQQQQTALITTAKFSQNNTSPMQGRLISQINPPPLSTVTPQVRDEFSTYGEYVANEMRSIANREVLIMLKNKINNALFEANMAELQK